MLVTLTFWIFSAGFAAESLPNLYSRPAPPPKGVTNFTAREIVTMIDGGGRTLTPGLIDANGTTPKWLATKRHRGKEH